MNLLKNIFTSFLFSIFVFIVVSFLFPLAKANAQTFPFTDVCGYDTDSHVEIFCDYTIVLQTRIPG